jgi:putative endonuclease
MCPDRCYYVYVLASRSRVLYTGVTSDLHRRVHEHKTGTGPGFTTRYRVTRLVYFESTLNVRAAIVRRMVRSRIRLVPGMSKLDPSLRSG